MKTEEKGSDVNLATYLLVDAFRHDADVYVVISNDSDLKEPIRIACHEFGLRVGIINPHRPERKSSALHACKPTFVKQIRNGVLATCQFPTEMRDEHGTFREPATW